jgi:uncharacterized protein YjbJ (UPF0337 family)
MANDDEFEGKVDNIKGRVKQAAGAVTGDKRTEAEGAAERVKGAAQEKAGEIKRKLDEAIEEDEDEDLKR